MRLRLRGRTTDLTDDRNRRLNLSVPPRSTWGLLFAAFAVNSLIFFGAKPLTDNWKHYSMALPLDRALPLVTPFIVIYLLAYVQWILNYWLLALDRTELFRRVTIGDILSKGVTLALFLLVPTMIVRPEILGGNLFDRLTAWIYAIDSGDRLFPSVHCLESWMALRAAFMMKRLPNWYRWASLVMTLLVFASVLLVKQHVLVDIPAGIIAAELGLWLYDLLSRAIKPRKGKI